MMTFSKNLYIGDKVKNPAKVKWKLRTTRGQLNIYLLTISGGDNQIDCFHNCLLKQKYFRKQPLQVVGLAGDYEEAVDLITRITTEVYEKTGQANIKEYLLEHF